MSSYNWDEFPLTGIANFELVARTTLETWRLNSSDMEGRLNGLESGAFYTTPVIPGIAIISGTLPYSTIDGLIPYTKLDIEYEGSPIDGSVPVFRDYSSKPRWELMSGVIGADTYMIQWNDTDDTAVGYISERVASEQEAIDGVADDRLMTPERTSQAIHSVTDNMTMIPSGMVAPFATETAPEGWLICDGSDYDSAQYPTLFAAIFNMYGSGNGSTTDFNVPDYRGQFLRGLDGTANNDPDKLKRTDRGDGTSGNAVGTKQNDMYRSHNHNTSTAFGRWDSSESFLYSGTPGFGFTWISGTGLRGGNETRPKNIYVLYCIKI